MTRMLLLAVLVFSGCGGGVDPDLSGGWDGTTTFQFSGYAPFAYSSQLYVSVSGSNATATGFCPDRSGTLTATGSGRSVEWTGLYGCPAVPYGDCPSVVFTFESAGMTLSDTEGLLAHARGTSRGCGISPTWTMSFR